MNKYQEFWFGDFHMDHKYRCGAFEAELHTKKIEPDEDEKIIHVIEKDAYIKAIEALKSIGTTKTNVFTSDPNNPSQFEIAAEFFQKTALKTLKELRESHD